MIGITSKLKDDATPFLKKITPELINHLKRQLKKNGADMEREIKQNLSKGGRTAGGRVHSPAGQPPYLQTGNLRASIGSDVKVKKEKVTLDIGAIRGGKEVDYARDLELGRSNMAARPYLVPVVVKYYNQFKKFFDSRWKYK